MTIKNGFSLIEVMIVLTIFSILAVISTQAILTTLIATGKAQSATRIRNDVDYTLSSIERNLHKASTVTICPVSDTNTLEYIDDYGNTTKFSCVNVGVEDADAYVASGAAMIRLTSKNTRITECSFTCEPSSANIPASVTINISATDSRKTGIEASSVTTSTQILLRNY